MNIIKPTPLQHVLLHYDIVVDADRDPFRDGITAAGFDPTFQRLSESVYLARMQVTEENIALLKERVGALLSSRDSNTRIFLALPWMVDGRFADIRNDEIRR